MKYSIITVNYNNRDGLKRTIESVIFKTFKDYEFIIIDGGSTDGSVEVIQYYAEYITYWVSEPDKGIYNAMNKGIQAAHGDYLSFMNSGDLFYQADVLQQSVPYLGTDIVQGMNYNEAQHKIEFRPDYAASMRFLYEASLSHQACFIRRTLFNDCPYREDYRLVSDWIFFVEQLIFRNCTFRNIPVIVVRFDGTGASEDKQAVRDEQQRVFANLLPPRILSDYEHFKGRDSRLLILTPLFNRTYRLEKFIFSVVRAILWVYYRIFKHNTSINIPR